MQMQNHHKETQNHHKETQSTTKRRKMTQRDSSNDHKKGFKTIVS